MTGKGTLGPSTAAPLDLSQLCVDPLESDRGLRAHPHSQRIRAQKSVRIPKVFEKSARRSHRPWHRHWTSKSRSEQISASSAPKEQERRRSPRRQFHLLRSSLHALRLCMQCTARWLSSFHLPQMYLVKPSVLRRRLLGSSQRRATTRLQWANLARSSQRIALLQRAVTLV
jgi:hypothetical protein